MCGLKLYLESANSHTLKESLNSTSKLFHSKLPVNNPHSVFRSGRRGKKLLHKHVAYITGKYESRGIPALAPTVAAAASPHYQMKNECLLSSLRAAAETQEDMLENRGKTHSSSLPDGQRDPQFNCSRCFSGRTVGVSV